MDYANEIKVFASLYGQTGKFSACDGETLIQRFFIEYFMLLTLFNLHEKNNSRNFIILIFISERLN